MPKARPTRSGARKTAAGLSGTTRGGAKARQPLLHVLQVRQVLKRSYVS